MSCRNDWDSACVATSTPDGTQELPDETEISIIPLQPHPCISLSESESEEILRALSSECDKRCPGGDNVHEQSTLRLDTPDCSRSPRDHPECPGYRSESPRKLSPKTSPEHTPRKKVCENRNKPSKVCFDPVPEVCDGPKPIKNEPKSPGKESKTALKQSKMDTGKPTQRKQWNKSKTDKNIKGPKKCRKHGKFPMPECTQTPSRLCELASKCKPDTVHFPKKCSSISEMDEESRPCTNEDCESALPDQSQSGRTSGTCEQRLSSTDTSGSTKPTFLRLNLYEYPKKCSSMSEIGEENLPCANEKCASALPDQSQSGRKSSICEQRPSSTDTSGSTKPCFLRLNLYEYPKQDSSISEIDEESLPCTNEECSSALPAQNESCRKSSMTDLRQSSSGSIKPTFLRLNLYEYPKKDSCSSVNDEETKSRQCEPCGGTSQTVVNFPKTCDQSTKSWFKPQVIKRSLEALRDTLLGRSEEESGGSCRSCEGAPKRICSSTVPATRTCSTANINTSIPESGSREICSSLLTKSSSSNVLPHRKKCVTIKTPEKTNICEFCDVSEECEVADGSDVNPQNMKRSHGDPCPATNDSDMRSRTKCSTNQDSVCPADDQNETSCDGNVRCFKLKLLKEESTQDSGGGSSCAGARERFYRDKLMSTLQILENKEETIRVQCSSLGVAEGRIAELTQRANSMRQELDSKARELNKLRQFAECQELRDQPCRVDRSDASIMAEIKDAETQKLIMATLEDNLSVIEELYRECFYETVKQEDLIDLLRNSYLDVRLMERDKTDKISRLQNIVLTQKRSLEQCQDVVVEVESLKTEISSFLSSSNNDSGMWERGSECPDVGEELGDILEQLRQLQAMLTDGCTCGLADENKMLKKNNEALQVELEQVKRKNNELEAALRQLWDKQLEKRLMEKERELQELRQKLANVENSCKERDESCDCLKRQLKEAQAMLCDKSAEVERLQKYRVAQDAAVRQLERDLAVSEQNVQEGLRRLAEMTQMQSEQRSKSLETIKDLERQLQRTLQRSRDLEQSCRDKDQTMSSLQASLEDAQARGACLCAESRRVTNSVRCWMRQKKALLREQQEKIKRQEEMLQKLKSGARQSVSDRTSQSETEPCCSRTPRDYQRSAPSCNRTKLRKRMCVSQTGPFPRCNCGASLPRCVEREQDTARCAKCATNRQESAEGISESEMASCSQAPAPPRRQRQSHEELNCPWGPSTSHGRYEPEIRWAQVFQPRFLRHSPTEDLLERVEHLHAALAAGQRRWGRACRR